MVRLSWFRAFLFALLILFPASSFAEKRVALVIGNSAYEHAAPLSNPSNDADDMAAKLEAMGFEVVSGLDLDLDGMRRTVRDFIDRLAGADMALFFYAGHGLQVNGENYMAPVDARLAAYNHLDFETLPINLIMAAMEREAKVNLVFLDACRDNPLAENLARSMGTRSGSVGRGLAKLGSGVGSLIAFATQPGNVALDGDGRNSPFTTALLQHLGTPGQDITRDLVNVRRDVLAATGGKQVPWDNSSLTGEVILVPKAEEPVAAVPAPVVPLDNNIEITFWNSIKDAKNKAYFETYLAQFPDGKFVPIAKLKIAEIDVAAEVEARTAEEDALRKAKEAEREKVQEMRAAQLAEEEKAILAKREQALREADEARKAAEIARQEVEKRLAELAEATKRAEKEVRNLSASDASSGQSEQQVASLGSVDAPAELARGWKEDRDLVRSIQSELNRVGCSAGRPDGIWGKGSERALDQYSRNAKVRLASLEPSPALLDDIRQQKTRICPLVCARGQEERRGRCVSIEAARAPQVEPRNNETKPDIRKNKTEKTALRSANKVCYICTYRGNSTPICGDPNSATIIGLIRGCDAGLIKLD